MACQTQCVQFSAYRDRWYRGLLVWLSIFKRQAFKHRLKIGIGRVQPAHGVVWIGISCTSCRTNCKQGEGRQYWAASVTFHLHTRLGCYDTIRRTVLCENIWMWTIWEWIKCTSKITSTITVLQSDWEGFHKTENQLRLNPSQRHFFASELKRTSNSRRSITQTYTHLHTS